MEMKKLKTSKIHPKAKENVIPKRRIFILGIITMGDASTL
jgi:hypothetical protein